MRFLPHQHDASIANKEPFHRYSHSMAVQLSHDKQELYSRKKNIFRVWNEFHDRMTFKDMSLINLLVQDMETNGKIFDSVRELLDRQIS